jgi:benzoyl-CoA 2,3-dioxygenase component A
MMTTTGLVRQHLIDPEVCIRCNTCEETCPIDAITHNDDNYVVDPAICAACGECLGPCPTGAIDSWRIVNTPHSIDAQWLENIDLVKKNILR